MRKSKFVAPRQGLTGAVFMIGLAILFATDWIWPGILVLIGITSLAGALIERSEPDKEEIPLKVDRTLEVEPPQAAYYATQCASCGAATPPQLQDGSTSQPSALCSFCGSQLEREK
jgi:hypothetical protein